MGTYAIGMLYTMEQKFAEFTEAQNLPKLSAEELIHEDLDAYQRRWISQFIVIWEAIMGLHSIDMAEIRKSNPY